MRMIRSRATGVGHSDQYYDLDKLRQIDEEQGRRQINGKQVEALVAMSIARQLAQDSYPVLKELAELSGATRRLNLAIPMLLNANMAMCNKVSGRQLLTIANNANDVEITLSAMPRDGMINISRDTMMHIVNRAFEACEFCTCNREQSKVCQLRAAYNNVPGVKAEAKKNAKDPDRCPYAGLVMEVENDENA